MRNLYTALLAALFFSLLLFPLLSGDGGKVIGENALPLPSPSDDGTFKIKTDEGTISLSEEDYICGVVAAEMPALYESEALKAQAVAAYTYACLYRGGSAEEWDLTDDSTLHQAYISPDERAKKWGEDAAVYEEKIRAAVRSVLGEKIYYEGEPIFAVYHAISAGHTESAKNIWGKDFPYLCGVPSVGDKEHESFKTTATFSAEELCKQLKIEKPADLNAVGIKAERSTAGTVLSFTVYGQSVKGTAVREALALRSANFTAEYKDGSFTFTVLGYGHGVGMSQHGANCLAKEGKTYREILLTYYPGTEIK